QAPIRVLDSSGGLRINGKAQVRDTRGEVIAGLYAGGEASGGGAQHGIGRASGHGYIAGTNAAPEPPGRGSRPDGEPPRALPPFRSSAVPASTRVQ
ncbi:FAD-binding protein, partial [Lacticaseibacillus rhamnosus]